MSYPSIFRKIFLHLISHHVTNLPSTRTVIFRATFIRAVPFTSSHIEVNSDSFISYKSSQESSTRAVHAVAPQWCFTQISQSRSRMKLNPVDHECPPRPLGSQVTSRLVIDRKRNSLIRALP